MEQLPSGGHARALVPPIARDRAPDIEHGRTARRIEPVLPVAKRFHASPASLRIGIISNSKSHRNRRAGGVASNGATGILSASPLTRQELADKLTEYAAEGVNLLVIDGGDGTVRDVITGADGLFDPFPQLAILPTGKTNALAIDLGIPADWTLQSAIDAAAAGQFKQRSPIEIRRPGGGDRAALRGFLFGVGGFVRATELAQRTHRLGAFKGLAVGLSLAWSMLQTMFGAADNAWRRGEPMHVRTADGREVKRRFYTILASTLERLPLGLKPFGHERRGLKMLAVDAPPRNVARTVPALLAGSEAGWLDDAGYHRLDPGAFELTLDGPFILDGECFDGGALAIRTGQPLHFVAP